MTTTLLVRSSSGTYPFVIGPDVLSAVPHYLQSVGVTPASAVFVVADATVHGLGYTDQVQQALHAAGWQVTVAVVPAGDESKSLTMAESLYNRMLDAKVRRNGVLLAVGGGVVGDLGGFVAATYQRGITFVQVPTTLLAHDSSLGGKVGINLPRGKNLVGAFHQPAAVLYDVDVLASLPETQWQSGMAEVIKHGIIGRPSLFESLERTPMRTYPGAAVAERMIAEASSVKVDIVERDERESELRMFLNLGHTVGHAVEQCSHYLLGHGQAVAIGMRVEAELAVARGWLSETDRDRIVRILLNHGLPVTPPDYPLDEIIDVLAVDKKHAGVGWTFVLPRAIGDVTICQDVSRAEVESAWQTALTRGESL